MARRTRARLPAPDPAPSEPGGRLIWLVPVAAFMLVSMGVAVRQLDYLTGIVLGLVVIYWVSKRPDLGLLGLIIFLPFQQVTFSLLLHFGLSDQLTRQAGSWKEGLAVGVAIAGVKGLPGSAAKARLARQDRTGVHRHRAGASRCSRSCSATVRRWPATSGRWRSVRPPAS